MNICIVINYHSIRGRILTNYSIPRYMRAIMHTHSECSRQRLTLFIVRAIELLDDADVFPLLETTQDANTNRRELRKLIGKAARRNDALFKEALLDAKTQLHDDDGDGLFLKFVLDEFA